MALQKSAVGIDFGADTVKAVRVRVAGRAANIESSVSVARASVGSSVARGDAGAEGEDPGARVAREVGELARELRRQMAGAGMPTKGVVLAIEARESIIRYNHVPPMPGPRLGMIMKYEVESIGERMGAVLASAWRVLPVVRDDGEQTVLLALAKEGFLGAFLDALESEGITVEAAVPAPLALFGAWDLFATKADADAPDDDLVLVVDLGRSGLNAALILNNRLVFARSGSFGGESFTTALASAFGIDRDAAERLKIQRGGIDASRAGIDDRTTGPLRSTAGQLLGFLQSSVRFGSSQTGVRLPVVTRLWFTGGGMRLSGLAEFLAGGLGGQPFESFDPSAGDGGAGPSLGMPLGLSAVGLQRGSDSQVGVGLSILPEKYRKRRGFRERTRWLIAAAAVLVALLGARLVQGIIERSRARESHASVTSARAEIDRMVRQRDEWTARSSRTRARINRLLHEAEPSAFQAFVLDFLARNLRPEIQLELVELDVEPAELEGGGVENRYRLVIKGRVNNEKRRAHDWVLDLQSRIQQEERVADARVESTRAEGSAWYSFEMVIEPTYSSI